jgi:hypothetical protein
MWHLKITYRQEITMENTITVDPASVDEWYDKTYPDEGPIGDAVHPHEPLWEYIVEMGLANDGASEIARSAIVPATLTSLD